MQGKFAGNDFENMCTSLLLGRISLVKSIGNESFSITKINPRKSLMFHVVAYVFTKFLITV
jgi:hypothetical protein